MTSLEARIAKGNGRDAETVIVILPVHDRLTETQKFVDCLQGQTYPRWRLIVVDDGSNEGTERYLCNAFKCDRLTVIRADGNLWWGGSLQVARNKVISDPRVRDSDFVLVMNNDTTFDDSFIESGLSVIRRNRRALLQADCFSQADHRTHIEGGVTLSWSPFSHRLADRPSKINCLATRGLLLLVGDFRRIGGFHPKMIPHYLSDWDFTHRAYRKGFSLCVDPSFRLYLNEGTTRNKALGKVRWAKAYLSVASPLYLPAWLWFYVFNSPPRYLVRNLVKLLLFRPWLFMRKARKGARTVKQVLGAMLRRGSVPSRGASPGVRTTL